MPAINYPIGSKILPTLSAEEFEDMQEVNYCYKWIEMFEHDYSDKLSYNFNNFSLTYFEYSKEAVLTCYNNQQMYLLPKFLIESFRQSYRDKSPDFIQNAKDSLIFI